MDRFRSRPRSPAAYDVQQQQLAAAYDARQDKIAERKAELLEKYGDRFAEQAKVGIGNADYDELTIGYAVDSMAQQYAERGTTDLSKIESYYHRQIEEKAVGEAFAKDWDNREADQKKWALGYEGAALEFGAPDKAAATRKLPPPGPEYGAEKVEGRVPGVSHKDLDRAHGEAFARLEAGEELRSDYGKAEPEPAREQEPARTFGALKAEQALATDHDKRQDDLESLIAHKQAEIQALLEASKGSQPNYSDFAPDRGDEQALAADHGADRAQAETDARLEVGEELYSDYGDLGPDEEHEEGVARTLADSKADQALATEREEGRDKLEFFEDREKNEDRDIGSGSHGKSAERHSELEFYEDRNPVDPSGPDLDI